MNIDFKSEIFRHEILSLVSAGFSMHSRRLLSFFIEIQIRRAQILFNLFLRQL